MALNSLEKIKCPHCGQMTSTATGFCDECGLELNSTPIKPITAAMAMATGALKTGSVGTVGLNCPNCGFALRSNAKHCPNCGMKIVRQDANGGAAAALPTEAKSGPPSKLTVGAVVASRYGLEGILGEGGMGRAWRAFDQHLNKQVVIKTIVAQDDSLRKALQDEAQTLINIRHPNIVSVFDFFTVENELCYVMEYITGPSWSDEIEDATTRKLVQPMAAEEALIRVKNLLPAFKYLAGLTPPIIYCDFKPSNVKSMTLPNGERIEVLLDFGTAYRYDPNVPPKPARGAPGYHSPQAMHPDWRDDYFTIGRTIAELVGMEEVHTEAYKYTLTPTDQFPWNQYDDSLRYFVEWLTAKERADRPQNVDEILSELDGVLGYVRGQSPDRRAALAHRAQVSFAGVTKQTMTTAGTGTVKIELPQVEQTNPAATILLRAQEAYEQQNLTRALQLANQAVNNQGGAAAHVLRSLIHNRLGDAQAAKTDLDQAESFSDAQQQWQIALAEGQLLENAGNYDEAAKRYRRMMAIKPGDYRGRLLLADLYRRSGNNAQAINEYRAIIQSKPNVGAAYIGAAKSYVAMDETPDAIQILETVGSRNASYNEVLLELITLYNQRALAGQPTSLDQSARAIDALHENGVETRQAFRLIADFYHTALALARKAGGVPDNINWPLGRKPKTVADLARMNEQAWRTYLARDAEADRDHIISEKILPARSWSLV